MFMLRAPRSSIFDHFDFGFDNFEHPHFTDFFEQQFAQGNHQNKQTYRKTKLQKALSKLSSQEININRQIKHYEASIDSLKKSKEELDQYKEELQKEIDAINAAEEKKRQDQLNASSNAENAGESKPAATSEKRVFKKVFYKTPEVEIEEQYDSTDPKNCFKIIRKEGQPPQILNTAENNSTTIPALDKESNESPSQECCSHKKASAPHQN